MLKLTVIICTHNPKIVNLNRVLMALQKQTLSKELWEIIVVDNNSQPKVEGSFDLNWHCHAKVIIENELGLTKARIKGISNANSEVLVFVDDDNLLWENYLETALAILEERPNLGAIGGNAHAEFEQMPSSETIPYLEMIAVRQIYDTTIGNAYAWQNTPAGAGMVIRKSIALKYCEVVNGSKARLNLDRAGDNLMSSGDIDMAYTSIDMGYSNGLFPELNLTHIIPADRVSKKYLIKLQIYNVLSNNILEYIRFKKQPSGLSRNLYYLKQIKNLKSFDFFEYKMEQSRRFAFLKSIKIAKSLSGKIK